MLYAKWDMEEALAVRYKEGYEVGFVIGTMQRNKEPPLNIAKKLLEIGVDVFKIQKYTGLDIETIENL